MAIERDSLVHVAAASCYGSVFGIDDQGVCEVGLIGPEVDDYSLRLPLASLTEIEPAEPDQLGQVIDQLALLHLRVRQGIQVARAFQVFVGRNEDLDLEVWFASGVGSPHRALGLDSAQEAALGRSLRDLGLEAWAWRPTRKAQVADVSLDTWSWALELIGAGRGLSAFGRGRGPEGLRGLCGLLADWGLPLLWEETPGGQGSPIAHG